MVAFAGPNKRAALLRSTLASLTAPRCVCEKSFLSRRSGDRFSHGDGRWRPALEQRLRSRLRQNCSTPRSPHSLLPAGRARTLQPDGLAGPSINIDAFARKVFDNDIVTPNLAPLGTCVILLHTANVAMLPCDERRNDGMWPVKAYDPRLTRLGRSTARYH